MLLKLLKLKANDAIRSGAVAMSSSGSVILRKIWNGPPPSTLAASTSSFGIDWSAPRQTRKKYGTVSQVLTRITENFAHVGVEEPRRCSPWQDLVDHPEVVVQQAAPDEQREEAGIA